jgi:hypothetical protein
MLDNTEENKEMSYCSRTRSKMHNINVNNQSDQNLFSPLHDATLFQGHGKSQAQNL